MTDTIQDSIQGMVEFPAYTQMEGQTISAATWDDSKNLVAAYYTTGHFIHSPVATDCDYCPLGSLSCKFFRMTGIFSVDNLKVLCFQMGTDMRLVAVTRYGIDYKKHIPSLLGITRP